MKSIIISSIIALIGLVPNGIGDNVTSDLRSTLSSIAIETDNITFSTEPKESFIKPLGVIYIKLNTDNVTVEMKAK